MMLSSARACVGAGGRRLEREHRTSLVALDEMAQQTGERPVYQKRGNVFFLANTKKVGAGARTRARAALHCAGRAVRARHISAMSVRPTRRCWRT